MFYKIDPAFKDFPVIQGFIKDGTLVPIDEASIRERISAHTTPYEEKKAFVNQRQTLVHLMRYGQPSILIHLPKLSMRGYSKTKMKWLLEASLLEAL